MLEQYTENEKKGFIKALVIGLVLGFIANYSAHAFVRESDTPLLSFNMVSYVKEYSVALSSENKYNF